MVSLYQNLSLYRTYEHLTCVARCIFRLKRVHSRLNRVCCILRLPYVLGQQSYIAGSSVSCTGYARLAT